MSALKPPWVHNTADVLSAIGVPQACPLLALSEGIRWRRRLACGGRVWLDHSSGCTQSSPTAWAIEGTYNDLNGSPRRVSLIFPSSGFDHERQFDWHIAAAMLSAFPQSAPGRSDFMQKQAEAFCQYLNIRDMHWLPEPLQTSTRRTTGSPAQQAHSFDRIRMLDRSENDAVLGYESAQGAVWLLRAPRQHLLSWWRSTRQSDTCRVFAGVAPRILFQPLRLRLTLPLAALTETLMRSLEVGSIVRLAQGYPPGASFIPAELAPLQTDPFQPFMFKASLDLQVRSDAERDRIDLRWRFFMSSPEDAMAHDSPNAPLTERITSRLTCVIADVALSLEDLMNLQPGDLLPSVAISSPLLELRIGKETVGMGELVRLGDALTVQIIEWNPSDTGARAHE